MTNQENQQIHNTTQFWEEANTYQATIEDDVERALFREHKADFQAVNFDAWIEYIEHLREVEIRYAALNKEPYDPQVFIEIDQMLDYIKGKRNQFDTLKEKVLP